MELQTFTCPNCGKSLEANPELPNIVCNACGTTFVPDMSTAKLAIHKASSIINKAMDQHQENKILKQQYRLEKQKEDFKQGMLCVAILFAIAIFCFILSAVM